MESIYTIKLKYSKVIKLLTDGGDNMLGRILLPSVGFETEVLMNAPFGKYIELNGGIPMSIRKKFWIGMLIYCIISWCFAFYLIRLYIS
jgi:hypothetical protein